MRVTDIRFTGTASRPTSPEPEQPADPPAAPISAKKLAALPLELQLRILPREDLFTYASQAPEAADQPASDKEGEKTGLSYRDIAISRLLRTFDLTSVKDKRDNNRFLLDSLRKGSAKVFNPILRQTPAPDLEPLFQTAAIQDDEKAFQKLLYTAKHTNSPISAKTLLTVAACGNEQQLESLLSLPNADEKFRANEDKKTALLKATRLQNEKIRALAKRPFTERQEHLWELLNSGPAATPQRESGKTMSAIGLLRSGVNIHHFNEINPHIDFNIFARTPLYIAASKGRADTVNALVYAGADLHAGDDSGETPLQKASREGHIQVVQALVQAGANVNAVDHQHETALHTAAGRGHDKIVKALVQAGADVDAIDTLGGTPLVQSAIYGRMASADKLIKAGADVDAGRGQHGTALYYAAIHGHDDVVDALIKAGADVNADSENGSRPLEVAAQHGRVNIVDTLLSAGADAKASNEWGITPLHRAARNGSSTIVDRLIHAGADVNAQDDEEIVPLQWAALEGHDAAVESLLRAGADVNAADDDGGAAIHAAALDGHRNVIERLIRAGADVNAMDHQGRRPIHYAERNGHDDIMQMLRDHGATD